MAKIIGNTTATTMPKSDWNQTDETKADYIKNKPGLPKIVYENVSLIGITTSNKPDYVTIKDRELKTTNGRTTYYIDVKNYVELAISADKEDIKLFVDGVQVDATAFNGTLAATASYKGNVINGIEIRVPGTINEHISVWFDTFINERHYSGLMSPEHAEKLDNINLITSDAPNTLLQDFENNAESAPSWSGVNDSMDEWAFSDPQKTNGNDSNVITTENGKVVAGAFGPNSVALNGKNQASGGKSFTAGSKNVALGNNAVALGNGTFAGGQHTLTSGNGTSALGNSSVAINSHTKAEGANSLATGDSTEATEGNSFSGGFYTKASGKNSFAIGDNSQAKNEMSVAEGYYTESSGYASHSMGGRTKAKAAYTLAGGFETVASGDYQTVVGVANSEDPSGHCLFIVGNGELNDDYSVKDRKNAFTVNKNGDAYFAGDVTFVVDGQTHRASEWFNNAGLLVSPANSTYENAYLSELDVQCSNASIIDNKISFLDSGVATITYDGWVDIRMSVPRGKTAFYNVYIDDILQTQVLRYSYTGRIKKGITIEYIGSDNGEVDFTMLKVMKFNSGTLSGEDYETFVRFQETVDEARDKGDVAFALASQYESRIGNLEIPANIKSQTMSLEDWVNEGYIDSDSSISENTINTIGRLGAINIHINMPGDVSFSITDDIYGFAVLYVDGKRIGQVSPGFEYNLRVYKSFEIHLDAETILTFANGITWNKYIGGILSDADYEKLARIRHSSDDIDAINANMEALNNYTTPEMFGAAGDGLTDDSKAIQDAIDTNKHVIMEGTYLIKNPIYIKKDNQIVTINGKLIVDCDTGIELTGSWNVIDGGGVILVKTDTANFARRIAIRFLITQKNTRGNEISVTKIYSDTRQNHNIGIEFTGNEVAGGGCYDKIACDIEFFEYGIWGHESEGQNESTWYSNLYVDGSIIACIQAVVFESEDSSHFTFDGSFLKGSVQPFYTEDISAGGNLFDEDEVALLPLVKVHAYCNIDFMFWDMTSSANSHAIQITGYHNTINSQLDSKYIYMPLKCRQYTYFIRDFEKNGVKMLTHGSSGNTAMSSFSNENDILLDCFNKDDVVVKISYDGQTYGTLTADKAGDYAGLFNGTNTSVTAIRQHKYISLIFEFAEARTLRGFALWGRTLPDNIILQVALSSAPDSFVELDMMEADIDYRQTTSSNLATWTFNYEDNISLFGSLYSRNIAKLKVDLICEKGLDYAVNRMSAFDVEPVGLVNTTKRVNNLATSIGNIDTVLDNILTLQNELWGEGV